MKFKEKYFIFLNIVLLGISIFTIEFIIQMSMIILLNNNLHRDLLNGVVNNPFNYNNSLFIWGAKNVFYVRLMIYLPIWIIAFIPGNSIFNIKNTILRTISYDLFLIIMTMVITFPISLFFFFSPFIYYLFISLIISPTLVCSIPYFRNFLKKYVEKGVKTESNIK